MNQAPINPIEAQAFNSAIFAQNQPHSFEGVNQTLGQAAPNMAAPQVEVPIDLRAQILVDTTKHENPAMSRWMAERETAKQQRFAEYGAFVLQTQSLFEQAHRAEEKKEKVNA